MSAGPPAGNGTMSRSGLDGYACATAARTPRRGSAMRTARQSRGSAIPCVLSCLPKDECANAACARADRPIGRSARRVPALGRPGRPPLLGGQPRPRSQARAHRYRGARGHPARRNRRQHRVSRARRHARCDEIRHPLPRSREREAATGGTPRNASAGQPLQRRPLRPPGPVLGGYDERCAPRSGGHALPPGPGSRLHAVAKFDHHSQQPRLESRRPHHVFRRHLPPHHLGLGLRSRHRRSDARTGVRRHRRRPARRFLRRCRRLPLECRVWRRAYRALHARRQGGPHDRAAGRQPDLLLLRRRAAG